MASVLARNPFIREAISNIHKMSHPLLAPLFLNEQEITASPEELLAHDFVKELGISEDDHPDPNSLKTSVKSAMIAAHFTERDTEELVHALFESQPSFTSMKANDNARRFGFASFHSLRTAVTADDSFKTKQRVYDFKLSALSLSQLTTTSPLLLTDEPAHFYRSLLARFCKSSRRGASSSSPLHPRIQEIVVKARRNAIQLMTRHPESCSINELAHQDLTLHRFVPRARVSMVLKHANKEELTINQLACFTCFLCPATVRDYPPTPIHDSLSQSPDPALPYVNYRRLMPHDGTRALFDHVQSQHLGPNIEEPCQFAIPCKACIQSHFLNPESSPLESAFVCCVQCGLDHSILLHSDSNRLLALYSSLASDFQCNFSAKRLLEHYLFTSCFACGCLFKTKEQMEAHQDICICQFISLSSGYGRTLTSEIFFTNSYIRAKEDEQSRLHATEQLSSLVQALTASAGVSDPLTQRASDTLSSSSLHSSSEAERRSTKGKAGKSGRSKTGRGAPSSPETSSSPLCHNANAKGANNANAKGNEDDIQQTSSMPMTTSNESSAEENNVWTEAEQSRRIALLPSSSSPTSSLGDAYDDTASTRETFAYD